MTYNKFRDNSNRLTIVFSKIPSILYWWYKRKIIKKFQLSTVSDKIRGIDTIFQTFQSKNGDMINIEWDVWSGFSIVALNKESEKLVNDILSFMIEKD